MWLFRNNLHYTKSTNISLICFFLIIDKMSVRPDEMLSRAGWNGFVARFGLRAVVWKPLIYSIFVLLFHMKLCASVPFFHSAPYKTSKIKILNLTGSLLTMFSGRILSVFIQLRTFHIFSLSTQIQCSPTRVCYIGPSSDELRADRWNLTKYRVTIALKQPALVQTTYTTGKLNLGPVYYIKRIFTSFYESNTGLILVQTSAKFFSEILRK